MASHKVVITFDAEKAALKITHRCTVLLAGHSVSHSDEIAVSNADPLVRELRALIEANKDALEAKTTELAAVHVAALGSRAAKGVKLVNLGGSIGISGQVKGTS